KTDIENLMIVSLYDNLFSIKIIENHMPVFNMIEEFEGTDSQYADIIENYVERIANFYRFNIRKGKSSLSKIVLFDLSNEKKVSKIYSSLNTKLEEFDLLVFDLTNLNSMIDDLPKAAFMAYLESLEKAKNKDIAKAIEFKLHRIPRINHFLNYVMALSFAIFTGISLVYIPFYTTNEEIINQTGLNNNLQNQLTILEEEVLIFEDYTQKEIDYSESFDYLDEADASISSKITDLQSFFTEEMELLSFEVSSEDSMITLVISTSDSSIFNGYLLSIYETFGINNETYDLQRWMTN
ncbi:MAG: hypothetical protein KJ971_05830, partial [Firmicutes bacterium]|nr:hypothetical protein [Bacillota bacterium]